MENLDSFFLKIDVMINICDEVVIGSKPQYFFSDFFLPKIFFKTFNIAWSLIRNTIPIVLFENTAMWLWSQRPLNVQGDPIHPSEQGVGQEKNNRKKWRAEEFVRHKGLLTP
jgi:hypothetical protein